VKPVPVRQQRRRRGPQVDPDQASFLPHLVRLDANLVLEAALWMPRLLKRLMKATSGMVEQPAVVIAAQAPFLDEAVRQVRAAVRTMPVHKPVVPALIAVQSQVLAQDAHCLHGLLSELRRTRDRMPVTPEQLPHRSSRTRFTQQPVPLFAQQGCPPPEPSSNIFTSFSSVRKPSQAMTRTPTAAGGNDQDANCRRRDRRVNATATRVPSTKVKGFLELHGRSRRRLCTVRRWLAAH
jgi:hypothetical protein